MTTPLKPHHCHHCGAICEEGELTCWHCDSPIEETLKIASSQPKHLAAANPSVRGSFSLASLLLLITLVSVVFGAFTVSPWVGVPMTLLLTIAGIRTVRAVNIRKSRGMGVSAGQVASLLFRAIWTTLALLIVLIVILWVSAIGGSLVFSIVHAMSHYLGLTNAIREVVGALSGWVVGIWIFLRTFHWLVWMVWSCREVFGIDPYDEACE